LVDNTGIDEMSDDEFMNAEAPEEVATAESDEVTTEEAVAESVTEQQVTAEPVESNTEPEKVDTADFDYKIAYEKVMATFKANGTDLTPKSPEDAQRLMQMGANYHKKMTGMKPHLKLLKTLENNGLLDASKLDYLIDLQNKNPAAIAKLLKDSNIDPMDVSVSEDNSYQPTPNYVSDSSIELDEVLEELQALPHYSETLNIVSKVWDETSRKAVAQEPGIMRIINKHFTAGVYDKVMSAVNYERSLGKLQGVSDLDAYKAMGNSMEKQGAFNTVTDPAKELQRKAQKKSVGSTVVKTGKAANKTNFDPLSMSDEDFDKLDLNTYLSKSGN